MLGGKQTLFHLEYTIKLSAKEKRSWSEQGKKYTELHILVQSIIMQGTGLGNPRKVLVIETSKITVFYELPSFFCQPSKTKILRSQTSHTSYYVVKSYQCDMLFNYLPASTNCIGDIFAKLLFQCILLLQKSNYSPKVYAISKVVIELLRINSFGSTGIFLACIAGARNKWVQERMGKRDSACYAGQYFPFCF